jgi:hypothetical protein
MKITSSSFFRPYKDLCALIGDIILACNPAYKYPKTLASTIIEIAHFQNFFMNHLPSLTDFSKAKEESEISLFWMIWFFASLRTG